MNLFENIPYIFITFGASLLCVVVAVLYQHFVSPKYPHQRMLAELMRLPLAQLLHNLGIPLQTYTHKSNWDQIARQITACRLCQRQNYCKQCFAQGECRLDEKVCPNYSTLIKLAKKT